MNAQERQAFASSLNSQKTHKGDTVYMFDNGGRQLYYWNEENGKVLDLDAYGGIMGTYRLGIDCFKVVRHRETVVTETWTVL